MQIITKLVAIGLYTVNDKTWKTDNVYRINRIHVPLQGAALYSDVDKKITLTCGSLFFLPNSELSNFKMKKDECYYHLFIDFYTIPPLKSAEILQIYLEEDKVIFHLIKLMEELIIKNLNYNAILSINHENKLLYAQFEKILEILTYHVINNYALEFIQDKLIEKAIMFIESNYMKQINSLDISSHLHIHNRHLLRLFRKHKLPSPHNYLRQCRLRNSITFLSEGKSVTETAALCGFQSDSAYRIAFKKLFGYPPKELKNNNHIFVMS